MRCWSRMRARFSRSRTKQPRNFDPVCFPSGSIRQSSGSATDFPIWVTDWKLGFHQLGPAFDIDAPRSPTAPDQIFAAAEYLARRFPSMRGAHLNATHVCHYEKTPNGDFLIDVHPEAKNVWLVGGGSGTILSMLPQWALMP